MDILLLGFKPSPTENNLKSVVWDKHCVASVRIRSYSSIFPAFSHNRTEYGEILPLRIHSECRKMRENADQNNSEYRHFLRSESNWSTIFLHSYFCIYLRNIIGKCFPILWIHLHFEPNTVQNKRRLCTK